MQTVLNEISTVQLEKTQEILQVMADKYSRDILSTTQDAPKSALMSDVPCKQQAQSGGNIGKKILNFIKKYNFDMIVMGSRGMGSAKGVFLGSTSNHVLHKSKIPVLIVK